MNMNFSSFLCSAVGCCRQNLSYPLNSKFKYMQSLAFNSFYLVLQYRTEDLRCVCVCSVFLRCSFSAAYFARSLIDVFILEIFFLQLFCVTRVAWLCYVFKFRNFLEYILLSFIVSLLHVSSIFSAFLVIATIFHSDTIEVRLHFHLFSLTRQGMIQFCYICNCQCIKRTSTFSYQRPPSSFFRLEPVLIIKLLVRH